MNVYRRVKSDPKRWFSDEEVEKAKSYQRPLARVRLMRSAVNLALLVVVIQTHAVPDLLDALGADTWALRLLAALATLIVAFTIVDLPFSIWETFSHEKRWGFSTETPTTFAADLAKGIVLNLVLLAAVLLPVWWLVRASSLWWLFGWAAFFAFTVVLALLAPIVLMPLFNRFTPLDRPELAEKLRALGRRVGLEISDVQVMDASKRTTKDNAFFAGLGRTRRVVLFDNILSYPDEMIEVVVAHELSHWRRRHVPRIAGVGAVVTLALFVALKLVTSWEPALRWAGVDAVDDPAVLPLAALVFGAGAWVAGLARNWFSRAWEREADLDALDLTRTPETFSDMMRRFATKNLSDVAPSDWEYVTRYDHPPIPERLAMAETWSRSVPRNVP